MSEGPSVAMGRPVTFRLTRAGTPAAYAAAVLAFAYAAVSLYWTMGGRLLLETVGGTAVEVARGGGMPAVLLGLTATILKVVAGLLALAAGHGALDEGDDVRPLVAREVHVILGALQELRAQVLEDE